MKKRKAFLIIICTAFMGGCMFDPISSAYNDTKKIAGDNHTFNINGAGQELRDGQLIFEGGFEGVIPIWTFEAEEYMELDVTYSLNVQKGKAKLVQVTQDGSVEDIIERTDKAGIMDYSISKVYVKKGENTIKLAAGKGAEFDLDIMIEVGQFQEVGLGW